MNSLHKTECVALADAFMDTAKGAQNYLKHVGHEDKLKVTDDTIFAGLDAYKKVMEMDNVDLVLTTPLRRVFVPYILNMRSIRANMCSWKNQWLLMELVCVEF